MIRIAVAFLSLIVLAGSAFAEGRMAVIAASDAGDVLVPGKELSSTELITLPAGAVITLLREDGQIVRLTGPYEGKAGGEDAAGAPEKKGDWGPLMALIAESNDESSVLGAARSLDSNSGLPGQPTVWQISVDSSGPRCVQAGAIELWRRKAGRQVDVALRSEGARLSGVNWPADEHSLRLPEGFTVAEGLLLVSFGSNLRELTLHVAPESLEGAPPGDVLSWLIDKGCRRQAIALIDSLHAGLGGR